MRILVGYAAGGPLDISARLIAQWLSERLGQQFIIENRPGAASNIATEAVVRARPDGYTLLQASASNAWNAALYDNLSFNFIRDIAPIATVRRAGVKTAPVSLDSCTSHFECNAHDARGFRVKLLVAEKWCDWHDPYPLAIHALEEVAILVADGEAHIHVELPRLCDRGIHD